VNIAGRAIDLGWNDVDRLARDLINPPLMNPPLE
jgi:hypothetical protein